MQTRQKTTMMSRLKNSAANGAPILGRFVYGLGAVMIRANRFIPFRQRYLLTRDNRLRLRYIVLPGGSFAGLAVIMTAMVSPVLSSGSVAAPYQVAGLEQDAPAVLAGLDEKYLAERMTATQKRLKRSSEDLQDRQTTDTLAGLEPAAGIGADRLDDVAQSVDLAALDPAAPLEPTQEKTYKIGSGDTLTGVLSRAGLTHNEAYQVVQAVRKHVDPRSLKPGQVLNIRFDRDEALQSGYQFAGLNMAVDSLRTVSVARGEADGGYRADMHEKEVKSVLYFQEAEVQNSLFGSAAKAGIPQAVVAEAIRIYSWDIDFQRDVRQGDTLQVLYEQFETEDGIRVKTGNILYARLTLGGQDVPIYRYEMKDGRVDYFKPNGSSIRKALMKTPVDGARMSSGYGMRRHPIQGYNKMHKGIDFAAPTGTPIYAAGDGVIERIGRNGGYGNYILLRHNGQLKTAYAHMSRFAANLSSGTRVRQGQVIGYVGSTGSSTGPHLHYEVLVNGRQVNPLGMNLPTGEILEGEHLRLFNAHVKKIERDLNSMRSGIKTAQATARPPEARQSGMN
jgi:murein DD-endopeptidase MepM/ murein hydrolase activator NlpD